MKTYFFYRGLIRCFGLGCLIIVLLTFFFNSLKAVELNVTHLIATQISDYQYDVSGYVLNRTPDTYAGTINFTAHIKNESLQFNFGEVTLAPLDSFQFTFIAYLTLDSNGNKHTSMYVFESGKKNNGSQKYGTVQVCVSIDENTNQSVKECTFTISQEEFQVASTVIRGRKARTVQKNVNSEFNEEVDLSFNVYPNPMVDITYLLVNSFSKRLINLQIFNNQGQEVKNYETFVDEGSGFIQIDMNEFGPGIYFFRVSGIDKLTTSTVVKN